MSSHQMTIRHSSTMRWTIRGKSYLGIRHITFHKLHTYLRCCICLCWGACEKMHMTLFVVRDGFSRRSCPNPALAFQARTGFRNWSIKESLSNVLTWAFWCNNLALLSGCNGAQTCAYVLNLWYNFKFSASISKCL